MNLDQQVKIAVDSNTKEIILGGGKTTTHKVGKK